VIYLTFLPCFLKLNILSWITDDSKINGNPSVVP
jgi:hypothetical protein